MSSSANFNKEYFNKEAAVYDTKHGKTLDEIVEKVRARLDFIGVDWVEEDEGDGDDGTAKPVRLLDYACGTGNISRALAPYTTQCVGIDLSEGMVAAYNTRAQNQGLSTDEMFAHQGNLCDPSDADPAAFSGASFRDFDVAAVGLGFHHFDDPELAAKRLAARLRKGGVLFILDFLVDGSDHGHGDHDHNHDDDMSSHPAAATVVSHGFTGEGIKGVFEGAGVGGNFGLTEIGTISPGHKNSKGEAVTKRVFLARGTKL